MKEKNRFLEAALFYALRLGWPVFPITPLTKIPLKGSKGCDDATTDEKTIREWWRKHPRANIAVRTGVNLWALDVDGKADKRGDLTLAELENEHGKLRYNLRQLTPNQGWHYPFAVPEQATLHGGQAVCGWKGIDVRAEGGYILVAPSEILTDDGQLKSYAWEGLDPLRDPFTLQPADAWLVEKLLARNGQPPGAEHPMGENIEHGVQHDTIRQFLIGMRRLGATREMLFAAAWEANQKNCEKPDKTPARMQQMVDWVMRKIPPRDAKKQASADRPPGPAHQPAPTVKPFTPLAGSEIFDADYPEPKPLVDPILYPGLTVLGGRPKAGKSWFALQLALAVISGEKLGNYLTVPRPLRVLYLSLEDRPRQTKSRLRKLTTRDRLEGRIGFVYEMEPALLAGGIARLDATLAQDRYDLVIIDSYMAAVQQAKRTGVDIVQADYNIMKTIREVAEKHQVCILVVHHTRKVTGGDMVDQLQGTSGTTAAPDAIWVLQRTAEGAILSVTGREVANNVFGLARQESGAWTITGEGDEVTQSDARKDLLQLLRDKAGDKGMKPSAMAAALRKPISSTHRLLSGLIMEGLVVKSNYGNYKIPGENEPEEIFEEPVPKRKREIIQ